MSGRQWVNLSSGLKGGAAFLLMMFLFFGTGHAASDGVFRINYGVIFNRIGSFRTVYDHWMHTCHINMPKEQFYKLYDTSRRSSPRRVAMRISIDLLIFLSEPVDRSTSNVSFEVPYAVNYILLRLDHCDCLTSSHKIRFVFISGEGLFFLVIVMCLCVCDHTVICILYKTSYRI